ncbi:MAG: MazG nucleotide pyrophosphohydrolase domain-containing protein [Planctomycetota bacterium]|jgi:uncharacterized protein YabN with tetrapyrrole methylase and pyrophosphatase domain
MDLTPLFEQIKTLRHPETGCHWDRKQTMADTFKNIMGEAEELSEAIQSGDRAHIREEAGDLLWNLCFVMALAEEEGTFSREEVMKEVMEKMTRRHPHVFGDETANTPEEALAAFMRAKQAEKNEGGEE